MEKKKATLVVEANVESANDAKELLDSLEALLSKYDVTIDLKICQDHQEFYTRI